MLQNVRAPDAVKLRVELHLIEIANLHVDPMTAILPEIVRVTIIDCCYALAGIKKTLAMFTRTTTNIENGFKLVLIQQLTQSETRAQLEIRLFMRSDEPSMTQVFEPPTNSRDKLLKHEHPRIRMT